MPYAATAEVYMSKIYTHREIVRDKLTHKETELLPCSCLIETPLIERVNHELGSTDW